MGTKWVYFFEQGSKDQKALLGGKGAGLAEMKRIGLPVPDGFTITTDSCRNYMASDQKKLDEMFKEVEDAIEKLEQKTGKTFGSNTNPLLVSVRSGAAISMPGMMDTILNLGLNEATVQGLATLSGNPIFAYDCYKRFIQMFSEVVLELPKYQFDAIVTNIKKHRGYHEEQSLSEETLKEIISAYKEKVRMATGHDFPETAKEQLKLAIESVFKSWNNPRAKVYRKMHKIPDDLGTAVNVQEMAFGNLGNTSGTGVAFTRNPSDGSKALLGEYLINAQGEDVVAGIRTPEPISKLKEVMPAVYQQFIDIAAKLENYYTDMQDIEFTIENEKLFLLQTRTAKRTAKAAIKIAVDMVKEGLIDEKQALLRIEPHQLDQLLHPKFSADAMQAAKPLSKGLPASPGAACGRVYFCAEDVIRAKSLGYTAILVRIETSPEDIEGMIDSVGILTARGGMTSHAAVVARGMGKCCVAGAHELDINYAKKQIICKDQIINEGDYMSLDGVTGNIYVGQLATEPASFDAPFHQVMTWADKYRKLGIRTNADNARDAKVALNFGAEGIGLCRTEHMFFQDERILAVRKMILALNPTERKKALALLMPYQQEDFVALFNTLKDKPITIRLLDPPLHEFLPHEENDIINLAEELNVHKAQLAHSVKNLSEINPMLGHRGCRLALTYPEIYDMQVEAILRAALKVKATSGFVPKPEIMVPLVGFKSELVILKANIELVAKRIFEELNDSIDFKIGTMIEVPRAALTADEIAEEAEFFSFGTNDLTQMGLGFSRDDSAKFIRAYLDKKVFERDPFESIDVNGVGKLVKIAVEEGRKTKPNLKIGICGEHGGEPNSIAFCHATGLDYVSCSPFRVPIARLSAAQAALKVGM